jgi:hypothetical protein
LHGRSTVLLIIFLLIRRLALAGANRTMAGGTDNFRAPAMVSAAASINVPGAPLSHRAVLQTLCNFLIFISFNYSPWESAKTCLNAQAKRRASCSNCQDSIWCTAFIFNVREQPQLNFKRLISHTKSCSYFHPVKCVKMVNGLTILVIQRFYLILSIS